jgi:hypothetical protein
VCIFYKSAAITQAAAHSPHSGKHKWCPVRNRSSACESNRNGAHTISQLTHSEHPPQLPSTHLSCCVSSKPTWPHFMAAYFSFRFQYSRNSVLQMPTNTAKYGMISAS